jgi:hypothetical protein
MNLRALVRPRPSLCLLSWIVVAGCGGDDAYDLAPVSGRVTLNGAPLAGAQVGLQPIGGGENPGPGSTGITDADGAYHMATIHGDSGAVVGKHRVQVWSNPSREAPASDVDEKPREERVPKRYNHLSELSLDVPAGGTDSADFELTAP